MNLEIISIGDELLIGQTVNTNATWLAKHLTSLGVEVKWITTVGDDADDIKSALATALQRSDVVITTGGIGPTHDDITKTVAADFFESELIFKPEILEQLKRRFEKRGRKMSVTNEDQAWIPEKAQLIDNPIGTAAGLIFEKDGKKCFILPGVPSEMKMMSEKTLFPMFKGQGQTIVQKTIRTTGLPESTAFEKLGDIKRVEQFAKVAFLPKTSGVDIRLTVKGTDETECRKKLEQGVNIVLASVGKYVYGYDDEELEEAVAKLLIKTHKTVAVAESCTGGLLANKLTNISGSSEYFERGVVTYSNQSKIEILGIPEEILEKHGAVSLETAEAMAEAARKISGADFGISTTGIAGPTGGTEEKPVGLVYIGVSTAKEIYSKRLLFFKERLENKDRFVQAALSLLKGELIKLIA